MKTVLGRRLKKRSDCGWTETHSSITIVVFTVLVYLTFFNPILRHDGIPYVAPARSLLIDGNLNTYNESCYYSIPGWNDVADRNISGHRRMLLSYVHAPDYTPRGYRHVVFPIGNLLTWLPPLAITHAVHLCLQSHIPYFAPDGFSYPYRTALGWWSFLIALTGIYLSYKLLRSWYEPFVSCFATLFVIGAGNLIPFITHDVTFSHGVDFLLINAILFLFVQIHQKELEPGVNSIYAEHLLWGLLIGYAAIVRYQVIAVLIFPVVMYIRLVWKHADFQWKKPLYFSTGFLSAAGLQIVYWKILYGRCLIPGQLMGTGSLPSFNPLKPDIIPMLFSRFHGFYNWLPWMLPLTLAAFLIIRRDKLFGVLIVLVMASQFYYNSTRTEWWNLGFSVRRFSSWSLFFMLGAAEIVSLAKSSKSRVILTAIAVPIVLWTWLFKIHFLMRSSSASIFPQIIGNAMPFHHDNFKPVIPGISHIQGALKGLPTWFGEHIWTASVLHGFKTSQYTLGGFLIFSNLIYLSVCSIFVYCLFNKWRVSEKKITCTLAVYFCLIYIFMAVSDAFSGTILAHKILDGEPASVIQEIRLRNRHLFEGENSVAELSETPLVFPHPEQGVSTVAHWLIGINKNSESGLPVIDISLVGESTCLASETIRFDDMQTKRLDRPWGDAVYHHEWYRFKTDFSAVCHIPEHWEISLLEGNGAVVGACWHLVEN
jgi:hypothetical protein